MLKCLLILSVCDAGRTGDNCDPCPLHFYKEAPGPQNCTSCPADSSTKSIGTTNSSECGEKSHVILVYVYYYFT